MAYKLTDEQKAIREAVTFTAGEGFDFGSGHYLKNWRRADDGKELDHAKINVLVHGGFKFREMFQHRVPFVRDLPEKEREGKEPLPARKMLTSRKLTCQESLKWCKHLVIRKAQMSEPGCPAERLIAHVKGNAKSLMDEVLFSIGDGCTTSAGKPEKVIQLTGYDLCNKNVEDWRNDHNIMAKGSHVGVVVPLEGVKGTAAWTTAGAADDEDNDFAAKIMTGTWGLFGKFEAEINRAIEDDGEDNADPRWAPAVYQIVFDARPRGGKKPQPSDQYTVHYLKGYSVPEIAKGIGGTEIAVDVQDEIKKLFSPATSQEFYDTLQAGLVADLDLATIMGYDPSNNPDEEREASPSAAKPPAEKPAAKAEGSKAGAKKKPGKRRVAVKKPDPAPEPEARAAEDCPECGTPWPEDRYHCPGRRGPKKCDAYNPDMDEPGEGEVLGPDHGGDSIPFDPPPEG